MVGLVGIGFEPVGADSVGEMRYFEVSEGRLETVAVGTRGKHTNFHGVICFEPCVAHHVVSGTVEGIEYFYGVAAPDSFDPYVVYGAVEGYDAPVGSIVCNDCAEIVFTVDKFDAGLNIVLVVEADHHAGLVEAHLIITRNFDYCFEFSAILSVIEGSVVDGKAVVRHAPIIAVRCDIDSE